MKGFTIFHLQFKLTTILVFFYQSKIIVMKPKLGALICLQLVIKSFQETLFTILYGLQFITHIIKASIKQLEIIKFKNLQFQSNSEFQQCFPWDSQIKLHHPNHHVPFHLPSLTLNLSGSMDHTDTVDKTMGTSPLSLSSITALFSVSWGVFSVGPDKNVEYALC